MEIRVVNQMAEEGMKLFYRGPNWSIQSLAIVLEIVALSILLVLEKDAIICAFINAACFVLVLFLKTFTGGL